MNSEIEGPLLADFCRSPPSALGRLLPLARGRNRPIAAFSDLTAIGKKHALISTMKLYGFAN